MKRKQTLEQPPTHYCGECANGIADTKHENLSLNGIPTLVSCPQSGKYKKVVSEIACEMFEPKN